MGPRLAVLATCGSAQLFVVAFLSRLLVFAAMAVSDWLIPDYDKCSLLYGRGGEPGEGARFASAWFPFITHWDGVHYTHIARFGYTHENLTAFFPAIPTLLAFFADLGVGPVGVSLTNIVAFSASAVLLRVLTRRWLAVDGVASQPPLPQDPTDRSPSDANGGLPRRQRIVALSVALFLLTPAAAFTVVAYTESVFCFLSFLGMALLPTPAAPGERGEAFLRTAVRTAAGAAAFVAATFTRSNGILLVSHLLFPCAVSLGVFPRPARGTIGSRSSDLRGAAAAAWRPTLRLWPLQPAREYGLWAVRGVLAAAVLAPYLWIGHARFQAFCVEAGDPDGTCPPSWTGFYAVVQRKYWHVGFLTYWTPNNIPNFFIAAPLHAAVWWGLRLGGFSRVEVFGNPQVLYLLGMCVIAVTNMHVQVVTRFVVACPALYWIVARGLLAPASGSYTRFIVTYFVVWATLSVLLFSNHYPWT